MEDFKKEIDKVIQGEISSTTSNTLISPDDIDTYLKEEGLKQEDFESNGWYWDFWKEYTKDGKTYILGGSGWYNNGLSFYLKTE